MVKAGSFWRLGWPAGSLWHSLPCRCTTLISAFVFTWHSPCMLSMSRSPHFYKGTGHTGLGLPSRMIQVVKNLPANNAGDAGSIHGSGRFPGEGNSNPLQYSCLGNPKDRGAWWATVHTDVKSQTRLSRHMPCHFSMISSSFTTSAKVLCPIWSHSEVPEVRTSTCIFEEGHRPAPGLPWWRRQ